MTTISLKEANLQSLEDQLFLYDVLKFRWSKADIVNIKYKHKDTLPTFEEHVSYINSDKFKKIYKVLMCDNLIGMVYIDKHNVNGTFIIPSLLKTALKINKQNNIIDSNPLPLSHRIHDELYAKHPEISLHYATVNPLNELSLRNLKEGGYEEVEIILAIKTKNGKRMMYDR